MISSVTPDLVSKNTLQPFKTQISNEWGNKNCGVPFQKPVFLRTIAKLCRVPYCKSKKVFWSKDGKTAKKSRFSSAAPDLAGWQYAKTDAARKISSVAPDISQPFLTFVRILTHVKYPVLRKKFFRSAGFPLAPEILNPPPEGGLQGGGRVPAWAGLDTGKNWSASLLAPLDFTQNWYLHTC